MNYDKLKGAIVAAGYSQRKLAEVIPIFITGLISDMNTHRRLLNAIMMMRRIYFIR